MWKPKRNHGVAIQAGWLRSRQSCLGIRNGDECLAWIWGVEAGLKTLGLLELCFVCRRLT